MTASTVRPATSDEVGATAIAQNRVELVGRVAAAVTQTELPSGDVVVSVRLVVERGAAARRPPHVDTINCSAWTARLRRTLLSWQAGDVVAVDGALRRRFWRSPVGAQSRYEVELTSAKRLQRG